MPARNAAQAQRLRSYTPGWTRFLGRHQLAVFGSYEDSATYTLAQLRNLIIGKPSFLSAAARDNPLSVERVFYLRQYLPPFGATTNPHDYGIQGLRSYGDLMETMYFTTAAGERFGVTAYENPVGGVGTSPSANHLQRGSLAASTSSRLVFLVVITRAGFTLVVGKAWSRRATPRVTCV